MANGAKTAPSPTIIAMHKRLALTNAALLALASTLFFMGTAHAVLPLLHALSALLVAAYLQGRSLVGKVAAASAVVWAVAQIWRAFDYGASSQVPVSILILVATVLLFIAFSLLQDRRLTKRSRLARTIDGLLLGIVVLGMQWFFFVDSRRDLNSFTVIAEFLVFIPFVSSLLFVMYSQRNSLLLANLGTLGTGLFSAVWFDSISIGSTMPTQWDLAGMAGLASFALATIAPRNDRNPSVLLPLLPYGLGIVVMIMGVEHSLFGPASSTDVIVMAIVGVMLILRQAYSYIEQRRLLAVVSRHENQMRHLAMHDPLTSLPNRALFQDRLEHAVAMHQRNGGDLSLIYIDIDGFKKINDTYGHVMGDELLIHAARRLATWVRPTDTVARLGGDEFVVLMEGNIDGAKRVAHRLESELTRSYDIGGLTIAAGASIGLASLNEWTGTVQELSERLVNRADHAMYQAKADQNGIVVDS